jgi:hypothetical protein
MPRSPSSVLSQRASNESAEAPLGIKVICALGVVGLLGIAIYVPMTILTRPAMTPWALFMVVVGVVYAVSIVGLWSVVSWGWLLAVALQGLGVVLNLLTMNVIGLLVGVLVLAYFFSVRDVYLG